MNYKKRGRAGSCGKKEAKGKISRERNYAKEEVKQALKELDEGDEYRYPHYARKELTKEQKTQKQLSWFEHIYERWTRPNDVKRREAQDHDGYFAKHLNWIRSNIQRLKDKL